MCLKLSFRLTTEDALLSCLERIPTLPRFLEGFAHLGLVVQVDTPIRVSDQMSSD